MGCIKHKILLSKIELNLPSNQVELNKLFTLSPTHLENVQTRLEIELSLAKCFRLRSAIDFPN